MIIQCAFPVSLNSTWDYAKKIGRLAPLPKYITKRSTHFDKRGAAYQVLILYEFDKSNFPEAMEYICKQLDSLHDVSEPSVSVHLSGLHPCYLTLGKGGEA